MPDINDMVDQAIDGTPKLTLPQTPVPGQAFKYPNTDRQPSDAELGIEGWNPSDSYKQYLMRRKATDEGWDELNMEDKASGGIPQDYVPAEGVPIIDQLNNRMLSQGAQQKQYDLENGGDDENKYPIQSGDQAYKWSDLNDTNVKFRKQLGGPTEIDQLIAKRAAGTATKADIMRFLYLTSQGA